MTTHFRLLLYVSCCCMPYHDISVSKPFTQLHSNAFHQAVHTSASLGMHLRSVALAAYASSAEILVMHHLPPVLARAATKGAMLCSHELPREVLHYAYCSGTKSCMVDSQRQWRIASRCKRYSEQDIGPARTLIAPVILP